MSDGTQPTITQAQLCKAMMESGISFLDNRNHTEFLQDFVLQQLDVKKPDVKSLEELKETLRSFLTNATKRFTKSCRKFDMFMNSSKSETFSNHLQILHGLFEELETKYEQVYACLMGEREAI